MTIVAPVLVLVGAEPASAATCAVVSQDVWGSDCDQFPNDYGVISERVFYGTGDGLEGIVCRPTAAGDYPIAVVNHGGFDAELDPTAGPLCVQFAQLGYYAIVPYYRTYDPTDGLNDDFCSGEVDDSLEMLELAKQHAHADEDTVVMRGHSHGGCVTLQAYQRGVEGLVAAAVIAPPVDAEALWQYFDDQIGTILNFCWAGPPLANKWCNAWADLQVRLEGSTGGPPSASTQAEYDERSPILDLPGLHDSDVPLLIAHGAADAIVPIEHTCTMVAGINALTGAPDFASYHYTTNGSSLLGGGVAGCPGFTWSTASNPATSGYPGDHYLFAYSGIDHIGPPALTPIYNHVMGFLVAKT